MFLISLWKTGVWRAIFPTSTRLAQSRQAEAQLLARAQSGGREAISVLLGRHRAGVLRLATAILHDSDLAQDAAQDALVRAFQKLPSFRAESEFSTWLNRLVINVCLERKRRLERDETPTLEIQTPSPAAQLETRADVAHCLNQLSETLSVTLVLRECSGHSYEEIAEILRVPVGTVRSRLSEARRQFKNAWHELEAQRARELER